MLQARIFAYADAQRYRVGVNDAQLPVNAPKCPFHNYQRDGAMQMGGSKVTGPNYEPNNFTGPAQCPPSASRPCGFSRWRSSLPTCRRSKDALSPKPLHRFSGNPKGGIFSYLHSSGSPWKRGSIEEEWSCCGQQRFFECQSVGE